MRLQKIQIADINTDVVPLDKALQTSLFTTDQRYPIKVRKNGNGYDVVDGRRRLKALADKGVTEVLALVEDHLNDTELSIDALVANSGKPNPMDEARHMARLREDGMTGEVIAELTGYSPARISTTLRLVDHLVPELQELVSVGTMKISAAINISKLPREKQEEFLAKVRSGEKPSVKKTSEELRNYQSDQMFFDFEPTEDVRPGLFLSADQMDELANGYTVRVYWNGVEFRLRDT